MYLELPLLRRIGAVNFFIFWVYWNGRLASGNSGDITGSPCLVKCMGEISATMAKVPIGKVNFQDMNLAEMFNIDDDKETDKDAIRESFHTICEAYQNFRHCIGKCDNSDQKVTVTKAYTGLHYICVTDHEAFFKHLPCLAENEKKAIRLCRHETSETVKATKELQSIATRKQHQTRLRSALLTLCKRTKDMISCMEPVTVKSCGEEPVSMMHQFIGHSFKNFEHLFEELQIREHLPPSCRELVSLATIPFVGDPSMEQNTGVASHNNDVSSALKATSKENGGAVSKGSGSTRQFHCDWFVIIVATALFSHFCFRIM